MEQETKRDRVRRLVLTPLAEAGFRFPRGTSDDAGKRDLDRLADGLGYLPDDKLDALRVSLMTKGQGTARCFWPSYASVIGLADGRGVAQDDQAWLNWYEKTEAMLRAMVDGVEA